MDIWYTIRTAIIRMFFVWTIILLGLGIGSATPERVYAQTNQVRAILFYSPTCPHCHHVIEEDLPPLFEKYPNELEILGINVSEERGQQLYQTAIETFNIPDSRLGVPTLIVGDVVLVGSGEIPQQLPGLIETYLAEGGIDWPPIPGLAELIQESEQEATPSTTTNDATPTLSAEDETAPSTTTTETLSPEPSDTPSSESVAAAPNPPNTPNSTDKPEGIVLPEQDAARSWQDNVAQDPSGNGVAIVVLLGMIGLVSYTGISLRRPLAMSEPTSETHPAWHDIAIPILSIIGIGVASYLYFVEATSTSAVCGPVGDCNTVQQSEYAKLFGIVPIGLMGIIGYVAIVVAWLVRRYGSGSIVPYAALALFAMTLLGTLFSIYLTFLEPFVIGATCMWCVTSAVVMTLLLWMFIADGRWALAQLSKNKP